MRLPRLRQAPPIEVGPGEHLLAWLHSVDGEPLGGTHDALYLAGERIPWEEVEAADWDEEEGRLTVSQVGTWGLERPEHVVTLADPGSLLQLVRERVTASIVLQRHVAVRGRRGVRVIARRAPGRPAELSWYFEYDAGLDPTDPDVHAVATAALAAAREELGGLY